MSRVRHYKEKQLPISQGKAGGRGEGGGVRREGGKREEGKVMMSKMKDNQINQAPSRSFSPPYRPKPRSLYRVLHSMGARKDRWRGKAEEEQEGYTQRAKYILRRSNTRRRVWTV